MIQNTPKPTHLISFGATNAKNNLDDATTSSSHKLETIKTSKDNFPVAKEKENSDKEKESPFQKLFSSKKNVDNTEQEPKDSKTKETRKGHEGKIVDPSLLFSGFINSLNQTPLPEVNYNNESFIQFNENFVQNNNLNSIKQNINNMGKNSENLISENILPKIVSTNITEQDIPYPLFTNTNLLKLEDLNSIQGTKNLIIPVQGNKIEKSNQTIFNVSPITIGDEFGFKKDELFLNINNSFLTPENSKIQNNNLNLQAIDELKNKFDIGNISIEIDDKSNGFPVNKNNNLNGNMFYINDNLNKELIKLNNGIDLLPFKNYSTAENVTSGFFILKNEIPEKGDNLKSFVGTIVNDDRKSSFYNIDGNKIELVGNSINKNEKLNPQNLASLSGIDKNENWLIPANNDNKITIKNEPINTKDNFNLNKLDNLLSKNSLNENFKQQKVSFVLPLEDSLFSSDIFPKNENAPASIVTISDKNFSNTKIDNSKFENIKNENTKIDDLNLKNTYKINAFDIKSNLIPGTENINSAKIIDNKINKLETITPIFDKQKNDFAQNKADKEDFLSAFTESEQNTGESKQSKENLKSEEKPIVFERSMTSQINTPIIVSEKNSSDFSNPLVSSATRRAIDLASQLQSRGGGTAKVQIQDDKLGNIELNIQMKKNNSVSMEIKASDNDLKNILEKNSDTLKKSLDSQNIALTDFKVTAVDSKAVHNTLGAMNNQNFSQQQGNNSHNSNQESAYQQNLNQNMFSGNFSNSFMNNGGNNYNVFTDESNSVRLNNNFLNKKNNVINNMEKNSITNIQRGANGSIKVNV